jgi:HSP20 family molecular chaperone IbpA
MSCILRHHFFPRSLLDIDLWSRPFPQGPSALEMFDPFDELDMEMNNSLRWLTRPSFLRSSFEQPRVPQKYRVTVDCTGYNSQSIKTDITDGKLIVSGREGERPAETTKTTEGSQSQEDFSIREFKKTYTLPKDAETEKMVSFVTTSGKLVVEIPLKQQQQEEKTKESDESYPRLVDKPDGRKEVQMRLNMPEQIDANEVTVTAKDRDVIIQGEYKDAKPDSNLQIYYYRRSTMPESTDMSKLKVSFEKNQILLNAPILESGLEAPTETKKIEQAAETEKMPSTTIKS